MRNYLIITLIFLIHTSCTLKKLHGPEPGYENYPSSVMKIPDYGKTVYIVDGAFYPGIILGDIQTFGSNFSEGVFFIQTDKIVFSQYEDELYLPKYTIKFSEIESLSSKKHGLIRIICFKNKQDNSFTFMNSLNVYGESVDKDTVVKFIMDNYNKTK